MNHIWCLLLIWLGVFASSEGSLKCPQLPPHTPNNINDLRPDDIKVVMAIGDSITAGFGIMGLEGELDEYRGLSWSIGGDDNATTLFKFFQHFSPQVFGGSVGYHLVEFCQDIICPSPHEPEYDVLNGAQSGAYTQNLPDQVNYLVSVLQNNTNIDFENDWKVLTLLIGANNLCLSCFSELSVLEAANVYEEWLETTLAAIQKQIPRVFVNVVEIFNISGVYDIAVNSSYCMDIHRFLPIECLCAFDPIEGSQNRVLMDQMAEAYNNRSHFVVENWHKSDTFAVVIQPCLRDGHILNIDWLSTLDCFHPSLLAHQGMAVALWNNMLTPSANKKTKPNMNDKPICPTNTTLLYTY